MQTSLRNDVGVTFQSPPFELSASEWKAIGEVARTIISNLDFGETCESLTADLARLIDFDRVCMKVVRPSAGAFENVDLPQEPNRSSSVTAPTCSTKHWPC